MDTLLKIAEIVQRTRVCQSIVYGWIKSGRLACIRLGAAGKRGAIRVAEADLMAFLESLKTKKGQQADKPVAPRRKIKLQHLQLPG